MKHEMKDNRIVKDTHQEGIARKIQRKSEHEKVDGHQGSMSHKERSDAPFKRNSGSLTPRQA